MVYVADFLPGNGAFARCRGGSQSLPGGGSSCLLSNCPMARVVKSPPAPGRARSPSPSANASPRPPSPPRSTATSSISTANCPTERRSRPSRSSPTRTPKPSTCCGTAPPTSWPAPSCGSSPASSSPSARRSKTASTTTSIRRRRSARRISRASRRRCARSSRTPSRSSASSGRPPRRAASSRICSQGYKVEHIDDDLKQYPTLSFYRQGEFIDLCRGPHIPHAGKVGAFKLLSIAGAYWKNDASRKQLQRLYGTAFFTQKDLDAYLHQLEEAKKRDHRVLGKQLKLFTISQLVGSGLILWMPKGATVRGILETFIKDELVKRGYQPVYTPHIGRLELYRTSGHFPYYRDAQFPPMYLATRSAGALDPGQYRLAAGELDEKKEQQFQECSTWPACDTPGYRRPRPPREAGARPSVRAAPARRRRHQAAGLPRGEDARGAGEGTAGLARSSRKAICSSR